MYFASISLVWLISFLICSYFLKNKIFQDNILSGVIVIFSISLILTFFIKVLFYFFDFNLNFILFSVTYFFFLVLLYVSLKKSFNKTYNINYYGLIFLILFIFSSLLVLLDNSVSFTHWDAVVSWNRWAIELSNSSYSPYPVLYPILWPSIWSLIYELQGSIEFEFIAKSVLLICFLIFYLSLYVYFINVSKFSALLIFLLVHLLYNHTIEYIVSGYMDQPVAILICSSLLLLASFLKKEINKNNFTLVASLLVLSLGTLTKQPALMISIFSLVYLLVFYFKNIINYKFFIFSIVIIFFPFFIFVVFHQINFDSEMNFFQDHFLNYNTISIRDAVYYRSLVFNTINIFYEKGGLMYIFAFIFPYFGTFFIKNKQLKFLNYFLLFIILIGFIIYANCCSYEIRNSYWLLMICIVAVANCFSDFNLNLNSINRILENKIFEIKLFKTLFLFSTLLFLISFLPNLNSGFVINKTIKEKKSLGREATALSLLNELENEQNCYKIVAAQQLIKFNFHLKKYSKLIERTSATNLGQFLNKEILRSEKCNTYWVFYDDIFNEKKYVPKFNSLIESGKIQKIDKNLFKIEKSTVW